MTSVLIILSLALAVVCLSQIVFMYLILNKKGLVPTLKLKTKQKDEANSFVEEKYMDLSDVNPEDGVKSLTRK